MRSDTVYLNHGSFGPPPRPVREAQRQFREQLDAQPMDFFVRRQEPLWLAAQEKLSDFVGADADSLALVPNATYAMNVVAGSFSLQPGDVVLLTNHEYGAVRRIWQRACDRAGAKLRMVDLPWPVETKEAIISAVTSAFSPEVKLLVLSHITSPTALRLPVEEITVQAKAAKIAVCIDGPHAVAQLDLNLTEIDCDFYTASCHKWLCAPFGSGFLYVHPRRQAEMQPMLLSWGRLLPSTPKKWDEEFCWTGTGDSSAFLSIPAAIDFLKAVPLAEFRRSGRELACYAREKMSKLTGQPPPIPVDDEWFVCMAMATLPPGDHGELQGKLWRDFGIEVPIIPFGDRWYVRVSCHLYNTHRDIDYLAHALEKLLA